MCLFPYENHPPSSRLTQGFWQIHFLSESPSCHKLALSEFPPKRFIFLPFLMDKLLLSESTVWSDMTESWGEDSQFSVPQIKCPLGGSSKEGSHVYFLLIVTMVLLLWGQIVLLWHQVIMLASEQLLWQNNSITQKTCNRKYIFFDIYC